MTKPDQDADLARAAAKIRKGIEAEVAESP
jgi:hypothetical protein